MSYHLKRGLIGCFAMLSSVCVMGQTVSYANWNSWFLSITRLKLSDNWSVTNEFHERTSRFLHQQGQLLIRPSIDYHLKSKVEFSLGYSLVRIWPYQPYTLPDVRNENNFWEQVLLKYDIGKVHFQSRFRQENRWVDHQVKKNGLWEKNGTDFCNRFRYRFVASFDLVKLKKPDRAIFFNGFDEFWFTQNNNLLPQDFTRNWLYLGIGLRLNKQTNFQIAFMHQYDKVGQDRFISTPIIQATAYKEWDIAKKKT